MDESKRVRLDLKAGALDDPLFQQLWEHISPRTTYKLQFETSDLITDAVQRVKTMHAIQGIKFIVREGELGMDAVNGLGVEQTTDLAAEAVAGARRIPDVLAEMCRRVPVSRATIARILIESGRLEDVKVNPSAFLDGAGAAINGALHAQLAQRIEYTPVAGQRWEAQQFMDYVGYAYDRTLVDVNKSITSVIPVDSNVERTFALALDDRRDVKLFVKLPPWFKVPTPLGGYNPDWAVVREEADGTFLYLVRETKGGTELEGLRFEHERLKIKFGCAHFRAINVDYAFGKEAHKLLEPQSANSSLGSG